MDAFVTARVPVELKRQVADKLAAIGATQTDLVNAAYTYVMHAGRLPEPERVKCGEPRKLSREQQDELRRRLEATTFAIPESAWEGKEYEDLLEKGRAAEYEAIS